MLPDIGPTENKWTKCSGNRCNPRSRKPARNSRSGNTTSFLSHRPCWAALTKPKASPSGDLNSPKTCAPRKLREGKVTDNPKLESPVSEESQAATIFEPKHSLNCPPWNVYLGRAHLAQILNLLPRTRIRDLLQNNWVVNKEFWIRKWG